MTIRNPEKYVQSIIDWKILNGCFGNTKIQVSDLDGIVERHGNILLLEHKNNGVPVPTGQAIVIQAIIQQGHTAIVMWGEPSAPTKFQYFTKKSPNGIVVEGDLDWLRSFVAKWFQYADSHPFGNDTPIKNQSTRDWLLHYYSDEVKDVALRLQDGDTTEQIVADILLQVKES